MSNSNIEDGSLAAAAAATQSADVEGGLSDGSGYLRRGAGGSRGRPSKRRPEPSGVDDAEWDRRDSDPPGRRTQASRPRGAAQRGRGVARAAQAGRTDEVRQDPSAADASGRAADAVGGEGAGNAPADRSAADSRADGQTFSSSSSSDNGSDLHDDDWDLDEAEAAPEPRARAAPAQPASSAVTSVGGFDALLSSQGTSGARSNVTPLQLREVTQEAVEWLFGVQRAGLLRLSSAVRSTASKEWLQNDTMARRLAKTGASVPTFATAPVYYYAFQWQCSDLLRDAQVDIDKAAEWAHATGRWFLSTPNDHSSRPDFAAVQTLARSLLANLEVAQAQFQNSPNPSFSHALHSDASGLMRRFFSVRGDYVAKLVRKALRAPILPAAHRPHIRTLGLAYRGMAAEFHDFLPRFVDNLDSEARAQGSFADAERFTGDAWLRFFQAFCRGILGGSGKTGRLPTTAFAGTLTTSSSTSPPAPTLVVPPPPPYRPPPYPPGQMDPAAPTTFASSPGVLSMWSTTGAPAPATISAATAAAPPALDPLLDARLRAISAQLSAPRALVPPQPSPSSPQAVQPFRAPIPELCIPATLAILGSYSPYQAETLPAECYECSTQRSHYGFECPKRYARLRGEPLPGWLQDGTKDAAAWSPDGRDLLPDARLKLAAAMTSWAIPEHPALPVTAAELAAPQPPAQRRRLRTRK